MLVPERFENARIAVSGGEGACSGPQSAVVSLQRKTTTATGENDHEGHGDFDRQDSEDRSPRPASVRA